MKKQVGNNRSGKSDEKHGKDSQAGRKEKYDEKSKKDKQYDKAKPKAARDDICILKYDKFSSSNFVYFERDLKLIAGYEFGDLFSFATTDKYPTDPVPIKATAKRVNDQKVNQLKATLDSLEEYDILKREEIQTQITETQTQFAALSEGDVKETDEALEQVWKQQLKSYVDRQTKREIDKPKLYWLIRRNMSQESTDKVREFLGADWEQSEQSQDPLALWRAIRDTHTAHSTGVRNIDIQQTRQSYYNLRMYPGETPLGLKERMDTAMRALKAIGATMPTDEEIAADYINKLDDSRYAKMKADLSNLVHTGGKYPCTLLEAYQLASQWKEARVTASGQLNSVFASVSVKPQEEKSKAESRRDSDGKSKSKTAAKSQGSDTTKKDEKTDKTFTCHICDDPKHFARDCPMKHEFKQWIKSKKETTNTNAVTTVEEETNNTFPIIMANTKTTDNDWLRHRVLLDNEAQKSVFCNKNYLTEISEKASRSIYTGQISGANGEVTKEGFFMDEVKVDYNPDFTTNILSQSELYNNGYEWGYEKEGNYYWLIINDQTLYFRSENNLYTFTPEEKVFTILTKREEMQASKAMELSRRLGFPSNQTLAKALRSGVIINTDLTSGDVYNAERKYGKLIPYLKGKTVQKRTSTTTQEYIDTLEMSKTIDLHIDLMFVGKLTFLVTVSTPLSLTMMAILKNKGLEEVSNALKQQIDTYQARGFSLRSAQGDADQNFAAALLKIGCGVLYTQLPPGKHDGPVESKIRRIKETARAIGQSLPYKLSHSLITWLMRYSTYVIHLLPNRNGYENLSPREAFTGVKTDFKKHLPCGFGDFCQITEKNTDNTLNARTFAGIALLPTGNGAVSFLNFSTGNVVVRQQFIKIEPVPIQYIELINKASDVTEDIFQRMVVTAESAEDTKSVLNLTYKQSVEKYGEEKTDEAVKKELKQMLDQEVITGVSPDFKVPKDHLVPSKLFLKMKTKPDGQDDTLKSRWVAGGHRQSEEVYERKTSPTASTPALFTVATVAAHEKKCMACYDVKGAYLWALRQENMEKVYIVLSHETASILVDLDNSWKQFVREDGTIVAEVLKALYGLIESAYLWYTHIARFFKELGFRASSYDPCVFFKNDLIVVLYVDDLFITAKGHQDIKWLEEQFVKMYGGSFKYPDEAGAIEFLGMKFCYSGGGVTISAKAKIDDVCDCVDSKKVVKTPAGLNLFMIDDKSEPLDEKDKKWFHTKVAKLLYIAKRTRPDILLAVNFLTSRVLSPTDEDLNKLIRVLKYLRGTYDLTVSLKIGDNVQVHAFVDASYATHEDCKSHTGMALGIGDALGILAKSTKQKIVSKSSTEAELIAASDCGGDLLSLKDFVEELGYSIKTGVIYQDNQSTIKLIENGTSSAARSKHIKIRTFWLTEKVNEGELQVKYTPTEDMVADGLTKPLQGAAFEKFRMAILGLHSSRSVLEKKA